MHFPGSQVSRLGSDAFCPTTLPRRTHWIYRGSNPASRDLHFTSDPHRKPKPHSIHPVQAGGPYLPTILKNIFCRFLPNLQIRIWHNFWLAKPYGSANQKLCLIPIYHWSTQETQTTFNTSWLFGKNWGSVFTNHSQEHSLSFSPRFANWNMTQLLIG